jgi:hypothetical protein
VPGAWSFLFERWAEPASVAAPCKQVEVRFADQSSAAAALLARQASVEQPPLAVPEERSVPEALQAVLLAQGSRLLPLAVVQPAGAPEALM